MNMDSELQKHYALLLGVGSPWEVQTVELKLAEKKVEIELGWQWGAEARCPECGQACSIHDCGAERTWRHLDTMQFTTLIRARTPRSECPVHGVKTMQVPWAMTVAQPVPSMVPAFCMPAKVSGTSISSGSSTGVEEPPGMTALSGRSPVTPPPCV